LLGDGGGAISRTLEIRRSIISAPDFCCAISASAAFVVSQNSAGTCGFLMRDERLAQPGRRRMSRQQFVRLPLLANPEVDETVGGSRMNIAIDARYSSDNQREASIREQMRQCRPFAERQGWLGTREYSDPAKAALS